MGKIWKRFVTDLFKELGKSKDLKRYGLLVSIFLGLIIISYISYVLVFLGKVYPNVMLGGVSMGGKTKSELRSYIEKNSNDNQNKPIKLIYASHTYEIKPSEVDFSINLDKSVDDIYSIGRGSGVKRAFLDQIEVLVTKKEASVDYQYDSDKLTDRLKNTVEIDNVPPVDASAKMDGIKLVIQKEKVGQMVSDDFVTGQLFKYWKGLTSGTIELTASVAPPKVFVGNEDAIQEAVNKLLETKLTLIWGTNKKVLTNSEIGSLIDFVPVSDTSNSSGTDQKILSAQFGSNAVKTYLKTISGVTDNPAKNAKLEIKDGKLSVVQKASTGQIIDVESSVQKVIDALGVTSNDMITVDLSVTVDQPIISEKNLDQLGITERIGYGETNWGNSPDNRKHNILNGVSLLQSALIAPGDEFSTVATLGKVDDTTGFLPELVIKDNKTVPEYGGGLCQVSTTLFRSVLNAGLKVTERQNHSYRVSYYEPPIGLDATVYLPKPDFKFLNDTGHYVLIQGRVVGSKVIFELWGTSDGRTGKIDGPYVSNYVDPPAEIDTPTDTLPAGTKKQTDKAHQGATAIVNYIVTRNGQEINRQVFKSVYKALPPKFLVGTGGAAPSSPTSDAPAATPVPAPTDTPTPTP